LGDLDLHQE